MDIGFICQCGPSINMFYHTLLHHLMVLLSHHFNEAFPTELSQQWEKLPTIKTHLQFHAWLKHVHISEWNTNQLNEKKFSNMMNHQTRWVSYKIRTVVLTSTGVWRGFNLIHLLLVEDDSYMSSDRILPWSGLFEISHDTGEFIMLSSGPCSFNNRFVFALHFFPSHSIKIRFGIILVGKKRWNQWRWGFGEEF